MIQMFHVYKAYPGDPPVLSDINLHVQKGEFVFLTGPSGAGKTTLMKLIFCGEKATKGQILVGGRNIARIRESAVPYLRRNIGVVFQDFKLLTHRTVEDNVAFALDVLGVPRSVARERVHRMLKLVGLQHKASSMPLKLSGGEQQRVNIARGFMVEWPVLLLDEPTASLDDANRQVVLELINEAKAAGSALIGIFHDRIAREAVDAWALRSFERALAAQRQGWFREEIVPVTAARSSSGRADMSRSCTRITSRWASAKSVWKAMRARSASSPASCSRSVASAPSSRSWDAVARMATSTAALPAKWR